MQFSEVAGQSIAKRNLVQMWQGGRMPHALLLLGREGTGGLPLALAFAQYVLCEAKTADDSCGSCANCRKVQRVEHADLHLSFPAFGPKVLSAQYIREFRQFVLNTPYGTAYDWLQAINAENKQGNITAEECRKIIEELSLKSYEGSTKIQIMWRPEYLGKEGNILLKLIEEPPADTLLLFVAESSEDILPTILSRTQLVRLTPIPPADIASALLAKGLADERRAIQVGQIADGSFTEALSLVDQAEDDLLPAVRELFNGVFTNNGMKLVQFTDKWSKAGREGVKQLLAFTLSLLEASVRVAYIPEAIHTLSPHEGEFAQRVAGRKLSVETLQGMIEAITQAAYYVERNAHGKSALLAMCIKMQQALRKKATR